MRRYRSRRRAIQTSASATGAGRIASGTSNSAAMKPSSTPIAVNSETSARAEAARQGLHLSHRRLRQFVLELLHLLL